MSEPAPNSPDATYARHGHVPVTVSAGQSGSQQVVTGIGLIICITFANTGTTTPARASLYDGTDHSGQIIAALAAPAAGSDTVSPGTPGIYFGNGLYYYANTGGAITTITYIPLTSPLK